MIYKYPEKFVVPVIYVDDLKEKSMYRDWEIKYLQVESIIKPDEKIVDDNIFTINEYDDEAFYKGISENKDMNYLKFNVDSLKTTYPQNMFFEKDIQENADNKNINSIFNDIDEEYASNETLNM